MVVACRSVLLNLYQIVTERLTDNQSILLPRLVELTR